MQTQKPRAYKITPTVRREIVQIIDERIKEAHVTKEDLGGLSRSFGYAFENEAYRNLPKVLKENYGITIERKEMEYDVERKNCR